MADGQNGVVIGMYVIWATCLVLVTGGATAQIALPLLVAALVAFLFNMRWRRSFSEIRERTAPGSFLVCWPSARTTDGVYRQRRSQFGFRAHHGLPAVDDFAGASRSSSFRRGPQSFHHRLQDRVGRTYGLVIYLGVVGASSVHCGTDAASLARLYGRTCGLLFQLRLAYRVRKRRNCRGPR